MSSSPLGKAIQKARRSKTPPWSLARLAREARKLAPPEVELNEHTVDRIEKARTTIRIDGDAREPIPYVLRALGLSGRVILETLGLPPD